MGGRTGSAEFAIGGAVNAALMNLTKVLADRGVKDGVRVNAINPGGIKTDRLVTRLKSFAAEHGLDPAAAEQQMAKALGVARSASPRRSRAWWRFSRLLRPRSVRARSSMRRQADADALAIVVHATGFSVLCSCYRFGGG